eukprot:gene16338-17975_t
MATTTSNLFLLLTAAVDNTSVGVNASPPVRPPQPPPQPTLNDDTEHTVHLMEVWTKNAADAYTIAPMLLRTGTYNNVLRVRWYWNKQCTGKHIILYNYTDDTNYPAQNGEHVAQLDQHSQSLVDIDMRPFNHGDGGDGDNIQVPNNPADSMMHISEPYVVHNSDGTFNQKQSIRTIAQANNVKCDVLKAVCEKTHHWVPCMSYNIFCKGKANSCHSIATACNLSHDDTDDPPRFCKLKKLFCAPEHDY